MTVTLRHEFQGKGPGRAEWVQVKNLTSGLTETTGYTVLEEGGSSAERQRNWSFRRSTDGDKGTGGLPIA